MMSVKKRNHGVGFTPNSQKQDEVFQATTLWDWLGACAPALRDRLALVEHQRLQRLMAGQPADPEVEASWREVSATICALPGFDEARKGTI